MFKDLEHTCCKCGEITAEGIFLSSAKEQFMCAICWNRIKEKGMATKKNGECLFCGKTIALTDQLCDSCANTGRNRYDAKKNEMHQCVVCGKNILPVDEWMQRGKYYHVNCYDSIHPSEEKMENYRYKHDLPEVKDPLIETNPLLKESEKLFEQVLKTLYAKNSDYAIEKSPFSNFENSAKRVGITVQQGILIRFNDKVERLCNLLRQDKAARVTGETIEDTICDAIGYLAILHAFRVGQMAKRDDNRK